MLGIRRCTAEILVEPAILERRVGDQKFTEPVALSSTQPADRPLPRRAFELRFDLIALRARCKQEAMGRGLEGQVPHSPDWCNLRSFSLRGFRAHRTKKYTVQNAPKPRHQIANGISVRVSK